MTSLGLNGMLSDGERTWLLMTIFQLKILAVLLMVTDHIGMYFTNAPFVLRLIGRLSFPLFLFCMTQGYRHTRSRKKYLLRLYGMSLVMSAIQYFCGDGYGNHNIFITLFWVGIFISAIEQFQKSLRAGCTAFGAIALFQLLFQIIRGMVPALRELSGDIVCGILPNPLICEFGFSYVLLGVALYFFAEDRAMLSASLLLLALAEFCNSDSQCFIALALPFLLKYNGEKGPGWKLFFYFFYPAHTLLLFWISARMVP